MFDCRVKRDLNASSVNRFNVFDCRVKRDWSASSVNRDSMCLIAG